MIRANDPALRSWVPIPEGSDFPIQNLPFGIFRRTGLTPRAGVAIGAYVADLLVVAEHGFFDDLGVPAGVFGQPHLNDFIALGRGKTRAVRDRLSEMLDTQREEWDAKELADYFLYPQAEVELLLPLRIGDYTDFYSSREHAANVGALFRDPENALPPNWLHLPVAYHGRASSVVVSGTPVRRPRGQWAPGPDGRPGFGASRALDFELETAFVIGRDTAPGESIDAGRAEEYIFGMVLFNDWSARDIQAWEYQPLGPFLGKNFASTMSPWIVTLDALAPFRAAGPVQDPPPLPYLTAPGAHSFDIHLEAWLRPPGGPAHRLCRTNFRRLYWSMPQQLAHHTVNGCNVRVGDLMASGTISGPDPGSLGCLLELTRGGAQPLMLPDGSTRRYLEDGDTVILRGWCEREGLRLGFGEATGTVAAAG